MKGPEQEQTAQVARLLLSAQQAVALTGAGMSTESGIPDFRSPGGIWTKYRIIDFHEFLESEEARYEYWRQKAELYRQFGSCRPNKGHELLAGWEAHGWLRGIITQNIDGFHQEAGSRQVLELHGTARWVACLDCQARFDAAVCVNDFLQEDRVPRCPHCGGFLKHAVISFGQLLDPTVLQKAIQWAKEAQLMIVIGSSLVVQPAASIPEYTRRYGGKLVIINREPTPLDELADIVIRGEAGTTLEAIDRWCARLAE